MSVLPDELRNAMRHWATGVSVVTTTVNEDRHGMTVNSLTSISLEPPYVMVSLERSTRTHGMVKTSGFFGVTILSANQEQISDCFAGRKTEGEDRFANVETFTRQTGAPFISGGLVFLDCVVVSTVEVGTHTLFIGEVVAIEYGQPGEPLLYYNRNYRGLQK